MPEHFNPFFQYSHLELVQLNATYTPARFERWFVGPMVTMRYRNTPFNKDWNLCHYYVQTAHDVAQPMSLRKQGLSRGKQLQICALQSRNRVRRKIAPHLRSRIFS